MSASITRDLLYLAALLHDIGKFYQRADPGISSSSQFRNSHFLKPNTKEYAEHLCPASASVSYGYTHVLWTYQFILDHEKIFQTFLDGDSWQQEGGASLFPPPTIEDLAHLSALHHKPEVNEGSVRWLSCFIQLADSLASWMDRTERPDVEQEEYGLKNQPFYPITAHILLHTFLRKASEKHLHLSNLEQVYKELKSFLLEYGWLPQPLTLKAASFFPAPVEKLKEKIAHTYTQSWEQFKRELEKLPRGQPSVLLTSLYYLLKKYLWAVPATAASRDLPDISLFEHLKLTAAFAVCLWEHYKAHKNAYWIDPEARFPLRVRQSKPFLLFCGDFAGIQNFIYNIYSKEARRSLKGRSFFLEVLCHILIQHLLDKLHLQSGHEVYASGGKFYLILPNTDWVKREIQQFQFEVEEKILGLKGWDITLCTDYVEFGFTYQSARQDSPAFGPSHFQLLCDETTPTGEPVEDLGSLWRAVTDKAALKKSRKFATLLQNNPTTVQRLYHHLFTPDPPQMKGQMEVCAITGEYAPREEMENLEEEGPDVWVLRSLYDQAVLGRHLSEARFLVIAKATLKDKVFKGWGSPHSEPLGLGWALWLLRPEQLAELPAHTSLSPADQATCYVLNDTALDLPLSKHLTLAQLLQKRSNIGWGFWFYGGNSGNKKTFEELCLEQGEEAFSDQDRFKRLGILRMDVDFLGEIFKSGLNYALLEEKPEEGKAQNPQHLDNRWKIHRKKSFSALATLSQQLHLFFAGYLNVIREKEAYEPYVQIVYSGGDDLFVVGRWDKVMEFARRVQREFHRFTLRRAFCARLRKACPEALATVPLAFGLSGGLELVPIKYPIQRAAHKAGEAEEKAKEYRPSATGPSLKNALTFLGVPFSWDDEYWLLLQWRKKFTDALRRGALTKSLAQKLFHYFEIIQRNELIEAGHLQGELNYSWQWNLAYLFARHAQPTNRPLLQEIQNVFLTEPRQRQLLMLALRWTELDLRTQKTYAPLSTPQ